MNNSCFLIPTHVPKYNYAVHALKTYNKIFNDDHIFFVFSSEDERYIFSELVKDIPFRYFIYDHTVFSSGIITAKKFFGLQKIFETTDFDKVGVIDSEVEFYRYVDYDKLFTEYLNNKTIHANGIDMISRSAECVTHSYTFFNQQDTLKIKQSLQNDSVLFFFNNIPLYCKEHFNQFLDYIDYNNNKHKLSYHTFDHIMYVYYLIVKDLVNIEILKYKDQPFFCDMGFLEKQNRSMENDKDMFLDVFNSYNPMWSELPIENAKNAFILMGLDRTKFRDRVV